MARDIFAISSVASSDFLTKYPIPAMPAADIKPVFIEKTAEVVRFKDLPMALNARLVLSSNLMTYFACAALAIVFPFQFKISRP